MTTNSFKNLIKKYDNMAIKNSRLIIIGEDKLFYIIEVFNCFEMSNDTTISYTNKLNETIILDNRAKLKIVLDNYDKIIMPSKLKKKY